MRYGLILTIFVICLFYSKVTATENNYEVGSKDDDDEQEVLQSEKKPCGQHEFHLDINEENDGRGKTERNIQGGYNLKWGTENGLQFEIDAHYQRNLGNGQPQEQHGVHGSLTIPIAQDDQN